MTREPHTPYAVMWMATRHTATVDAHILYDDDGDDFSGGPVPRRTHRSWAAKVAAKQRRQRS